MWHTCVNSYGNGYTPNKLPLETQGGTWGVLRGQQFKSLGKLSDWHQFWFTSADLSGNGHRLNTSRPQNPRWHFGGGLGCPKFKSLGKLSNGWTDWPQIWHTSADPSGNGYTPNKLPPRQKGVTWWVLGVKHSKVREPVKRLDRLTPTLLHVCGFIWEWAQVKSKPPLNTPGGISGGGVGVTHSKILGSCQTAAPIGTKFGTRQRIRLGMDIG